MKHNNPAAKDAPFRYMLLLPLIAALLASAGCAPVQVADRQLIFDRMPATFTAMQSDQRFKNPRWQSSFRSQKLQEDIETLMQKNLNIMAMKLRIEQAAIASRIVASGLWPTVDLLAGSTHTRAKGHSESSSTSTENIFSIGAVLAWEPDIWGRLRSLEEASSLGIEKQKALSDQTELDMQTLLVESWIAFQAACRYAHVLKSQQQTNRQVLELTTLRLAHGEGNGLDVLQQRGRQLNVERLLPAIEQQRQEAANGYAVLLGRFPGETAPVQEEWTARIEPLEGVPTPRTLLGCRPDLRAVFLALQVADKEAAAAVANRLPQLSIALLSSIGGSRPSRLGDQTTVSFVTGLLAPIFDAGRKKMQAELANVRAAELLAILEQAMLTAVVEVEDRLAKENALLSEHHLLGLEMAVADEAVNKARLQYVHGQETFLSVLLALFKLQTLQQQEIMLVKDILTNRARLLKALGARWSSMRS